MSRSTWAWISIGGNKGETLLVVARRLESSIYAMAPLATGPLVQSPRYVTPPWGGVPQPEFLNQVVGFQTQVGALEILDALQAIELDHGRERVVRWGPRTLDLDLLMLGQHVVQHDRLTLPHPLLAQRRFVLQPWADVAPQVQVPGHEQTVAELLAACPDGSEVSRWSP
ncbi:MAG: 2-amino-4-hydroxy-6-hydroxymethyldihydropteridine diphosphokinase [Bradymonadia bacterium]